MITQGKQNLASQYILVPEASRIREAGFNSVHLTGLEDMGMKRKF